MDYAREIGLFQSRPRSGRNASLNHFGMSHLRVVKSKGLFNLGPDVGRLERSARMDKALGQRP
jgi:hypothetical protein